LASDCHKISRKRIPQPELKTSVMTNFARRSSNKNLEIYFCAGLIMKDSYLFSSCELAGNSKLHAVGGTMVA